MLGNWDDTVSSQDILDRIAELRRKNRDADEQAELRTLRNLQEDCQDTDFDSGDVTLIRHSYIEDWAQEYARDQGMQCDEWPYTCIDWEQAADELVQDYTSVEWDGVTYYVA